MTTLILVRHGQSESNLKHIFCGQTDVKLTEKGHAQAKKTAEYIIKNYKIDKIYSSDLQRAYDTGKYIADSIGIKIIKDRGLREINAGDWECKTYEYIEENHPDDYWAWRNDIGAVNCLGGESIKDVAERFYCTIENIAKNNDGKTVVITTHSCPLRAMNCLFEGLPLEKMQDKPWLNNASVSVVEYNKGKFSIKLRNEDEHLAEINAEV